MVQADDVIEVLRRHVLVDGFDMVLDTDRSSGATLIDARDGTRYLDMFSFFASSALGMNHPGLVENATFMKTLTEVAVNKPSNSDVYTTHLATFMQTFARVLGDPNLPHLFFVEGGGLAVENALKTAFDWKRRHNEANGRDAQAGTKVLHLTRAFHGRTGYTMSLTNTDPNKVALFPKFDWPRIDVPVTRFPLDLQQIEAAEAHALEQARAAFDANPHDIACFIAEPIQGEGGDNHLRAEFLQAMQRLCHDNDALFILDEVQTGCGLTGSPWVYQQLGVAPDIVAFGKKLQVCGIMAGGRVDEVPDNVFHVSSRLNSTWGGNLTDMVRAGRILEVIESDDLISSAERVGKFLLDEITTLAAKHDVVTNPRGRGLMAAIDLPGTPMRDAVVGAMMTDEQVLILGSGDRSIRFRPILTITEEQIRDAVAALDRQVVAALDR